MEVDHKSAEAAINILTQISAKYGNSGSYLSTPPLGQDMTQGQF